MSKSLQAIRGMNDILPEQTPLWRYFEGVVANLLDEYGYRQIRMPIVEFTELFKRSIGEVTDIVEKEMYSFEDRLNGEQLTLRPEFTAGVVRAAVEHNLTYEAPQRLWSIGPVFRHERPQRGRYRQFHQVNVEALGFAGPDIDAELMVMLARLWKILGIGPVRLEINCLGQAEERARHRAALIEYFARSESLLDADAKRRLYTNPLRILDSKNPALAELVADAPRITDFLGADSQAHFARLQALLNAAGVPFAVNPRIVRGLDYYNLTVFEWITDALGAQGTICGGGRYDTLIERMGGRVTPAIGFGMGIERVIELLRATDAQWSSTRCDAYVLHQGGATQELALRAAEAVRDAGLDVILHAGEGSLKSQMRKADASGAEFALIVGESEAAQSAVAVKSLRGSKTGPDDAPFAVQTMVPLTELGDALVSALERISE